MATPIYNKLLEVLFEPLEDVQAVFEYFRDNVNINNAAGVWLDRLGEIVGLDRPYREQSHGTIFAFKEGENDIDDPFKGFESGGTGGYFQVLNGLKYLADPTERMIDSEYRTRILGKAIANHSSGTLTDIWRFLTTGYGLTNPTITNNVGSVNVTIADGEFLTQGDRQLAEDKGPVAAGIGLNIDNWTLEHLPFTENLNTAADWDIVSATIDGGAAKALKQTAAGVELAYIDKTSIYDVTSAESAYGSWNMWVKSPAAANTTVMFVAADADVTGGATQFGYYFAVVGTDLYLVRRDVGSGATLCRKNGVITDATWHKITITRSAAGLFTLYVDDVIVVPDSGSNPVTDTTHTSGQYWTIDSRQNNEYGLSALDDDTKLTSYTPL